MKSPHFLLHNLANIQLQGTGMPVPYDFYADAYFAIKDIVSTKQKKRNPHF